MEIYENLPWIRSGRMYQTSENVWKFMKPYENLMNIYENLMNIYENQWKSMTISRNSMKL